MQIQEEGLKFEAMGDQGDGSLYKKAARCRRPVAIFFFSLVLVPFLCF